MQLVFLRQVLWVGGLLNNGRLAETNKTLSWQNKKKKKKFFYLQALCSRHQAAGGWEQMCPFPHHDANTKTGRGAAVGHVVHHTQTTCMRSARSIMPGLQVLCLKVHLDFYVFVVKRKVSSELFSGLSKYPVASSCECLHFNLHVNPVFA